MSPIPVPINLSKWIRDNRANLKPPVANKQLYTDSPDVILFVSGGPNTRNDYHVNPTEELFYQLKGDIAVRLRPLDGSPPYDQIIREGELFLLPRWVPHRPQRPANTVGLIAEFPRGVDEHGQPQKDGLRWYCPSCDALVHEARWVLRKIDEDLAVIMEAFWGGPEEQRTCKNCGTVIQRATEFKLRSKPAKNGAAPRRARPARRAKPAARKAKTTPRARRR